MPDLPTFFVRVPMSYEYRPDPQDQRSPVIFGVQASDADAALLIARGIEYTSWYVGETRARYPESVLLEVLAMADEPACRVCPWRAECDGSNWNDNRWTAKGIKIPTNEKGEITLVGSSLVHTCAACGIRALSIVEGGRVCREVPEGCPRWTPGCGSACHCSGCGEA